MNQIVESKEAVDALPNRLGSNVPDSYPALAVGCWVFNTNSADGNEYEFVLVTKVEGGWFISENDL